jgi:hypothetical protein
LWRWIARHENSRRLTAAGQAPHNYTHPGTSLRYVKSTFIAKMRKGEIAKEQHVAENWLLHGFAPSCFRD